MGVNRFYKSKHFKAYELCSKAVYNKYGDKVFSVMSRNLLMFLDKLREDIGCGIVVNNWYWGGNLEQRGFRGNKDEMVAKKKGYYLSQHVVGQAIDFHAPKMSTRKLYNYIKRNYEKNGYDKYITRMESSISTKNRWIHVDDANIDNKGKLYIFKA